MSLEGTEPRTSRFADFGAKLRAVTGRTLNVALPPLCPACRELVRENGLCAPCWGKLSFIAPPYCERLGIPFAYDPGPGTLSMQAIADPPAYGRSRAAVCYDEIGRTLVQALKYGDRLELVPLMGRLMAHAGQKLLTEADVLVPVPLHWRRLWMRRFNQSTLLAKAISHACSVPVVEGALKRVKPTVQQVGLSKAERAKNVQGAFRMPTEAKAAVKGRRLILVDDVQTSGATVDACAKTFLRAGAVNVDVLVFARVDDLARPPLECALAVEKLRKRMVPVEIYTTALCSYCQWAKELLNRKGVSFTEIDVGGNRELRAKMTARTNGQSTVPQIFIGAQHIGGCDELYALEDAGRLDPLLNSTQG